VPSVPPLSSAPPLWVRSSVVPSVEASLVPSLEAASSSSSARPVRPGVRVARWLIGAAVVVLLAVAAVLGFVTPGLLVTRVLDQFAVQDGVRAVLQHDHRLGNVTSVLCPPNQRAVPGHSFDCTAVINNNWVDVPVVIQSRDGRYQVGLPL
jgi:hypothetical protein